MDKFEIAVRNKYRFPFKGVISVEDLWDLNMSDLDKVYKSLNAQKKQSEEDSLMSTRNAESDELQTKIDIVKHVYTSKVIEKENREKAAENYAKRQRIMQIIANKQDAALENMSEDELKAMLAQLG